MKNNNNQMISVEEAKSKVFSSFSILGSEQIAVSNAFGRVLAEDIYSRLNQPPVAVSSMDGYAVRTIDVRTAPSKLKLIGESAAGSSFGGSVSEGQTVRIFTGAALPRGADSIVIQENTIKHSGTVTILTSAKKGDYVRPKGLDFKKGKKLITAGQKLNYRHLSLIAAMNVPWVNVVRKPRIAILATGNELAMPGEINDENQIVSSNSIGLATFVTACGGEALNLGIAEDKPESILKLVSQIDTTDLLVTIGGASVGEYDLVRPVLIKKGLKIKFNKVAMRPGKPLIFGKIDKLPMFGLPGNPVSAGVTAILFLKPVINLMLGQKLKENNFDNAFLTRDIPKNDFRQDYLRAKLASGRDGRLKVTPFLKQDSSMLATFTASDCLILRKPAAKSLKAGSKVQIIYLSTD